MTEFGLIIGGVEKDRRSVSREVTNPSTGAFVGEMPIGTASDVGSGNFCSEVWLSRHGKTPQALSGLIYVAKLRKLSKPIARNLRIF